MDHVAHFHREILAFEAAARAAGGADAAPLVLSCPGWSVPDLVLHLGIVHRYVARLIREELTAPPDVTDRAYLGLPDDLDGWPSPERTPYEGPVAEGLTDWFSQGAAQLEALFRVSDPALRVWTWSREQSGAFWLRIQAIEAAVHRWDAESAIGVPQPMDAALAADAVPQTIEVMAPARRAWTKAPAGSGERYRFRQTDGPGDWTAHFDGDEVRLLGDGRADGASDGARDADGRRDADAGAYDVELAGTASDLMLFLWRRIPADRLQVTGDRAVLDRYFTLVPPV
ncbi:maleylpyruvate isomerase N-terminal domain-containing protein [Streptomyces sp. NPDC051907]|uniref:maleylpyruvate isomerase N-terminal domain-containing protein n=1 Tax=Streptomyces sp. NPDC051907 TaxID=3155284 RepID=UPI00341C0AA6